MSRVPVSLLCSGHMQRRCRSSSGLVLSRTRGAISGANDSEYTVPKQCHTKRHRRARSRTSSPSPQAFGISLRDRSANRLLQGQRSAPVFAELILRQEAVEFPLCKAFGKELMPPELDMRPRKPDFVLLSSTSSARPTVVIEDA